MRSNNTFIFLIVAVVSFLVYWFFIRKKPDDISNQPSPGEEEPSLPVAEMQEIEQITNPDESVKKEEYAESYTEPYTEYAEGGYDFAKLSNNITATLKWKNKGGFQDVKQITLTHKVGTTEVNKDVINKFGDDGTTEIEDNKKYFINRSGDTLISHTFDNKKTDGGASTNLVGTNTFTVGYTLNNGDKGPLLPASGQGPIELVISEDQLRLSLELFEPSSQTYKPKSKGAFTSGMSKDEALAGTEVYFQWDWKSDADKCYRRIGHMFSMDQIKIVEGAVPTGAEEKQGYKFQVILDDNRRAEAGAYYDATGSTTSVVGDIEPQGLVAETYYYIKKLSASTITTPEMVWLTSNEDNAQEFKFVDPPSTIKSKLINKNYFNGGAVTTDNSTTAKPTRFMFNKDGKDFYMGYSKGSANRSPEKNPDAKEAFHLEYFTLDMAEEGYMLDCVVNTKLEERYKGHGCDANLKNNAPKWGPVRHTGFSPFSNYKQMKGDNPAMLGDGYGYHSRGLRNRIRYMGSVTQANRPYVRTIKDQPNFLNS